MKPRETAEETFARWLLGASEWRYVRVRPRGLIYDGVCGRVTGWTHDGLVKVEHVRSGDVRWFAVNELEDITEEQHQAYQATERSGQG